MSDAIRKAVEYITLALEQPRAGDDPEFEQLGISALAALQSMQGEPVFMWCKASDDPREQDVVDVDCACEHCVPLYTHPQSPAVPEGYVLVPIEPTSEMLSVKVSPLLRIGNEQDSRVQAWRREIYKSMVKAGGVS